jgi:hypothetical protein
MSKKEKWKMITIIAIFVAFSIIFGKESLAANFIVRNVSNTNQIYFIVNGTTGYVGIGTGNPAYPLHVIGDVYWTGTLQNGIVPWARLQGYNLDVAWSGKLGWGNLTGYNLNVPWTGLLGWRNLTGYDLNVAWSGKLGWGNLTGYNLNVPWTGLLGWRNLTGYDLNVAWSGKLGWGNLTGYNLNVPWTGLLGWRNLTGYDLNVAWSGKLGWGNLTGYPSIIAEAGLTGGGDLSTSRSLSIAFGEDFLGWRNLTAYPSPCPAGHAVQAIGDTLTCIQINATQGVVNGTGTAGYIPLWISTSTLGNSLISQSGGNLIFGGSLNINNNNIFGATQINASAFYQGSNRVIDTVIAGTGLTGGGSGPSVTLSLATSGVTAGTYGSASQVAQFTVDSYGRITSASNVSIAIDASQIVSGTISSARLSGIYSGITGLGTQAQNLNMGGYNITNVGYVFGNLQGTASNLDCVDCVTLGTETTGNYVAGITAGTGIVVSGTPGEGWSPTVAIDTSIVPRKNVVETINAPWTFAENVWFNKNVFIAGNLSYVNVATLNVNGSLIPIFSGQFDVGNLTYKWRNVTAVNIVGDNVYGNVVYSGGNAVLTTATSFSNAAASDITVSGNYNSLNLQINAGAVGTNELADSAVTTAKIADRNVTLAKLNQTSCPAGQALQSIGGGTYTCIQINATQGVINGSGLSGQVAFFTASNTISGSNNLYWDNTSTRLGIGTNSPSYRLTVSGGDIYGSNNLYIAGNVGIGTTAPAYKLDVAGDIRATGTIYGASLGTSVLSRVTPIYIRGTGLNNNANRVLKIGGTTVYDTTGRGLRFTVISKADHSILYDYKFDTFGSSLDADNLANNITYWMSKNTIGILTSYDAWENAVTNNLRNAFKACGLTKALMTPTSPIRQPYAAIFECNTTTQSAKAVEVLVTNDTNERFAEIRGWLIDGSFVATGDVSNSLTDNKGRAAVFVDSSGNVGIGTTSPTQKLTVIGNINTTGSIITPANISIGINASALGSNAIAIGLRANASATYFNNTAIGVDAKALNNNTVAIGNLAIASGSFATALGRSASASSGYATALGSYASASGLQSTALGVGAEASAIYATALGSYASASGLQSTALGYYASASSSGTTALGVWADASAIYATALGSYASASGLQSTAIGSYAKATGKNSIAIGPFTNAPAENSTVIGIGLNNTVAGSLTNTFPNSFMIGYQTTPLFFINYTSGNVGIGTTSPSEKLEVSGNIKLSGHINLAGSYIRKAGSSLVISDV